MKARNYQCRKCGKINQITTPWGMMFTPHLGWHKWLKCECGAKRHFQRRVFQPEMKLMDEVEFLQKSNVVLLDQRQEALHNLEEADGYYCSMIDNLRDDIQDLKQQLALEGAALNDATKKLANIRKQLANTEAETAKKIFADMDAITSEYMNNENYSMGDVIFAIDDLKEKYGVED